MYRLKNINLYLDPDSLKEIPLDKVLHKGYREALDWPWKIPPQDAHLEIVSVDVYEDTFHVKFRDENNTEYTAVVPTEYIGR